MIVDAHHHLWDPATRDYPWMTGEAARLRRRFDGGDLREAIAGLVTEARHPGWTADDLALYVARLVELFGPARLLFGSDWPVCTLAASYRSVLDAARTCLARAGLGEPELAEVLAGTAVRVYGLDRP
jgi:predicted TIM-barrel fold metal-dependent hydrolase